MTQIQNSKQRIRLDLFPQLSSSGYHEFAKRCDITVVDVLVIEYWNLKFICNLVLEIWDFMGFKNLLIQL